MITPCNYTINPIQAIRNLPKRSSNVFHNALLAFTEGVTFPIVCHIYSNAIGLASRGFTRFARFRDDPVAPEILLAIGNGFRRVAETFSTRKAPHLPVIGAAARCLIRTAQHLEVYSKDFLSIVKLYKKTFEELNEEVNGKPSLWNWIWSWKKVLPWRIEFLFLALVDLVAKAALKILHFLHLGFLAKPLDFAQKKINAQKKYLYSELMARDLRPILAEEKKFRQKLLFKLIHDAVVQELIEKTQIVLALPFAYWAMSRTFETFALQPLSIFRTFSILHIGFKIAKFIPHLAILKYLHAGYIEDFSASKYTQFHKRNIFEYANNLIELKDALSIKR